MIQSRGVPMRRKLATGLLFSAMVLWALGQNSSDADVTQVTGSALGYFSMVGLFGGPSNTRPCADNATNTDCRPRPAVSLPEGGSADPVTASEASGDARYGPGIIFTSGPITVSTQGTTGPAGSVTSSTDIQQVNTSEVEVFTADRVSSTCTASEAGVSGSTTVTNGILRISEGDPDVEGDDTNITVPTNPAPNTSFEGVIEAVGDSFTYIFNEQITDPATGTLTVNAGHLILEGPTAVGDLFFGRAVCGVNATATPGGTGATTTTIAGSGQPGATTTTQAGGTGGTGTGGTGTGGTGGTGTGGTGTGGTGTGGTGTGGTGTGGAQPADPTTAQPRFTG